VRNLILLLALLPGLATAAERLRTCAPGELQGPKPKDAEVEAHRLAPLPSPVYPPATKMADWGMFLTFAIDAEGRPTCFVANSGGDEPYTVNPTPQREALFDALADWRYRPFERGGKPVPVVVEERLDESLAQENMEAMPKVPEEEVWVSFDRSTCLGTCPAYRIEIRGNGHAAFVGEWNVDVLGRHEFQVPREQARALVRQLRGTRLWSLRTDRRAIFPDAQFNTLKIMAGTRGRELVHGLGFGPQLPDFNAFTEAMESLGKVKQWRSLSPEMVQLLQREGFRFDSEAGRQMLLRAVGNDWTRDEAGLLALVAAGAPLDPAIANEEGTSLLDLALVNGHEQIAARLIERGALQTGGRIDQGKLDSAFQHAIRSAKLTEVEMLWNSAGAGMRPSLDFTDTHDGQGMEPDKSRQSSVITQIRIPWGGVDEDWQGLEVAKFLVAKGADPKSVDVNGESVLTTAMYSGDGEFVRWALAQGLDPAKTENFDLGDYEVDEDTQLALLEAGYASTLSSDDREKLFASFERYNRQRAMAWLVRHPQQ